MSSLLDPSPIQTTPGAPIDLRGSMVDKYEHVVAQMQALEHCQERQIPQYQERLVSVLYAFIQSTWNKVALPECDTVSVPQQQEHLKHVLHMDWPFMGDTGQCSDEFASLAGYLTQPLIYAHRKRWLRAMDVLLPLCASQVGFQNNTAPIEVAKLCAHAGHARGLPMLWDHIGRQQPEQEQLDAYVSAAEKKATTAGGSSVTVLQQWVFEQRVRALAAWMYTCIENSNAALLEQAAPYVQMLQKHPCASGSVKIGFQRFASVSDALARAAPYEVYDSGVEYLLLNPPNPKDAVGNAQLLDKALDILAPRYWATPKADDSIAKMFEQLETGRKSACNGLLRLALYADVQWALPVLQKHKVRTPSLSVLEGLKQRLVEKKIPHAVCDQLIAQKQSGALNQIVKGHLRGLAKKEDPKRKSTQNKDKKLRL